MNERKIKILGVVLVFLINLASGWAFEDGSRQQILLRIITLLLFMILQWEVAHQIIKYGRKKFPELGLVKKRVRFTAIYFFSLSVVLQVLNDLAIDNIINHQPVTFDPLRLGMITLNALLFTLTTIGMFEPVYYYTNFSRAEMEKKELLRENLQSQLDSLKGQVNPHFLFNSLNTLSSLITKDSARAEAFVEKLSNVYRYLLQSNQHELVTLKSELNFLDSYIHLLTTRFGGNIIVTKTINANYEAYLLPPLTLQLLIENAVKHNIVSSRQPLQISIFTDGAKKLHIVNQLQRKYRQIVSGKVGLNNIAAKYKLLNQPEVEIIESATEFAVTLALIENFVP